MLELAPGALLFDIFGSTEGGPFAFAFVRSPRRPAEPDRPRRGLRGARRGQQRDRARLRRDRHPRLLRSEAARLPRRPEKTAETYRLINGKVYVAPGDYVRRLGGGRIEFLGRGSSTVNTGGEKVYPAEVEDVLRTHPAVTRRGRVRDRGPRWGQAVSAVVAVRSEPPVGPEELRAYVGERLAGYKKPKHLVVVDSLERTQSGKADMRRLKAPRRGERRRGRLIVVRRASRARRRPRTDVRDDLGGRDAAEAGALVERQTAREAVEEAGRIEVAGAVVSTTRLTGSAGTEYVSSPRTTIEPSSLRVRTMTLSSRRRARPPPRRCRPGTAT